MAPLPWLHGSPEPEPSAAAESPPRGLGGEETGAELGGGEIEKSVIHLCFTQLRHLEVVLRFHVDGGVLGLEETRSQLRADALVAAELGHSDLDEALRRSLRLRWHGGRALQRDPVPLSWLLAVLLVVAMEVEY